MAEYIDKKYLDRKFQIDMMCARGGTLFDTEKIINSLPTADVVEREKIDKAIEVANDHISTTFKLGLNERAFGMREILEVFMKI